ncbi:acyl carrier protein, partial [Gluconobacter kondonii]
RQSNRQKPEITKQAHQSTVLRSLHIIVAIEEHFNIRLKTREIDALKSVGDLYETVLTKVS